MDIKLAEALVARGVLPVGTEIRAKHKALGLGSVNNVDVISDFSIKKVVASEGKVSFTLANLRNGETYTVPAENVLDIDGMDPVRFANVFDITEDGGKAILGKRRGRKPKNRQIEVE